MFFFGAEGTLADGNAEIHVGGLVGQAKLGKILNCVNSVEISISNWSAIAMAGGIVGLSARNGQQLTIGCGNKANISITACSSGTRQYNVGGIFGSYSGGTSGKKNTAENCWNTGACTITSTNNAGVLSYAGGIAGDMVTGQVGNFYSVGSVSVTVPAGSGKQNVGSLFGDYGGGTTLPTCAVLEGIQQYVYGTKDAVTAGVSSLNETELKAASFLAALNSYNSELTDYAVTWASGTDGYPVVDEVKEASGIKNFTIDGVAGVIDQDNKTITVELPTGTDITALTPTIECYGGETASPAGAQDFTNPVIYTVSGIAYTVTVNVAEPMLQGSGTEADPYLVPDAASLVKVSELFNGDPTAYANQFWKQTADIDMSGINFTPIGSTTANAFSGTYDGGGYSIRNLNITYSADSAGLFGTIGTGAVIRNVILAENCSVESSAFCVGGIVGSMKRNESSIIENCVNYGSVLNKYSTGMSSSGAVVGGIVGDSFQTTGQIIGCNNYGSINHETAAPFAAGGIVGKANGTPVVDCHNFGSVTAPSTETWSGLGNGSSAGGITAFSSGMIVGCSNTGTVSGGYYVGGIVGQTADNNILESCYNTGSIINNSALANPCSIGGVVGHFGGSYLNDCYNVGEITIAAGISSVYSGAIAGNAPSRVTKEIRNICFVGAEPSEAFGNVHLETAEATPLTATELKSSATVTALNDYPEPWSLYKVTWAEDSGSTNGGYPVIQSVTAIPSFYAELKSFAVTLNGKTYTGTINRTEVSIVLPYGTTTVSPTVTVSDKATVSPADGASVNLSSGMATYTVTAENGKQVIYTVKASIPASPNGLAALRLSTARGEVFSADDFAQDTLNYSVSLNDQSLIVLKTINSELWFSPIPAEQGATLSASLNGGAAKAINAVADISANGGTLVLWGPSVTDAMHPGENTITLTVTPPSGGSGVVTTYTIKLTLVPTLETLSLTDADTGAILSLTPAFDPAVTEYTLDVPAGTENLQISAAAYLPNIEDVILPENSVEGKLPVSGEGFDIKVGKDENVTTYHFAYASLPSYKATLALTPSDAVIAINDPNGNYVRPEADGSYKLTVGYTYQYTAAKNGYVTATGTFSHDSTADYPLTVTLTEVSSSGQDIAASDWPSFRGNEQNLGTTSAFTPESMESSELKWAASLGTGYSNAPSIPILVDGKLIIMSSNKIFKLSLEDGSILQSADMVKAIDWGYTPATYADGMIFAPLTDGTVQAFDAETLESLWVYTDPLGGQSVSPIYYYDGYVYTGFWNSEIHKAAFVCLPVTDENPSSQNETKAALWRDVHTGGFYWAGAVAVGDYLIYGTDDGVREGQDGTANLISRNRITGVLCDTEELVGDQRSSIAYADGKLYFTTKKGNLYQAALNTDGTFASLKVYQMGGMATGTPVVYNGLVFANSLDGDNQFGDPGATYVLNAADLSLITKAQNKFYNQSSLLLSTAYAEDGKLYLYGTYNGTPGGMEVLVYDTSAKTLTVEDFFIPDSDKQEYGICSPICDANGTIYYKNDSANIFAIVNKNADALAAAEVDGLIDAIGTVTLESKAKIDAARTAYDALTETQKALVTNLAALLTAEAKYEELKAAADQEEIDRAAAKGVDDLIDAIGEVTLESESAITAARSAYNALTDEQKARVTKLEALTAAETKLNELKADKAAAEAVEKQIVDIGEVTVESENAITAARTAYDALTDAQKALVTNLSVLTAAEAKLKELKDDSGSGSGGSTDGGKKIRVTMRLIGAELAEKDVDLGAEAYLPDYVTWIPTTSYELDEGAKVYDLWVLATQQAGIRSVGAERDYVETVYAPGGYELSEFTNGNRSGWMYTVNGTHPGRGLTNWTLNDGDVVIWHYINDYSYECADWFNEGQWQALGDGTYYNQWLLAPDYVGGAGGGIGGSTSASTITGNQTVPGSSVIEPTTTVSGSIATATVTDKTVTSAIKAVKDSGETAITIVPTDTGNAKNVSVTLPKTAAQSIVDDTNVSLVIETNGGNVTIPNDALKSIAAQASGGSITITVEQKTAADVTDKSIDTTDAVVVAVTITSGRTAVTEFGGKSLTISIPAGSKHVEGQNYKVIEISADGTQKVLTGKCVKVDGKLVIQVSTTGLSTFVATTQKTLSFTDVKESDYYYEPVKWAVEKGITVGTSDTTFSPDASCTRAQMVTFLWRAAGSPKASVSTCAFTDVDKDAYYYEALLWAVENGITNGTSDTTFSPDDSCTRGQMATFLYRNAKSPAVSGSHAFNDVKADAYYNNAVIWAAAEGITKGTSDTTFSPDADCTRGQMVTFLYRYLAE